MNEITAKKVIFPTEPSSEEKDKIRKSNLFNGIPYYTGQWVADIRSFPTYPSTIDIAGFLIKLGYSLFEFKNGAIHVNFG